MKCTRVQRLDPYLAPASSDWTALPQEEVRLVAAPLAMQPTAYVRNAWAGKPYGETTPLRVASVHDGHTFALRLSWTGVAPAGHDFPDAIAAAFPVRGNPPLVTMGAPDAPIHILRWQADRKALRSILATGIGSSRPGPELAYGVEAASDDGTWHVVLTRPLGTGAEDLAPLAAGTTTRIGFAVWRGGNDERAGIKAYSIDWAELALDA